MKTVIEIFDIVYEFMEMISLSAVDFIITMLKKLAMLIILAGAFVTSPIWILPYGIWNNNYRHEGGINNDNRQE